MQSWWFLRKGICSPLKYTAFNGIIRTNPNNFQIQYLWYVVQLDFSHRQKHLSVPRLDKRQLGEAEVGSTTYVGKPELSVKGQVSFCQFFLPSGEVLHPIKGTPPRVENYNSVAPLFQMSARPALPSLHLTCLGLYFHFNITLFKTFFSHFQMMFL